MVSGSLDTSIRVWDVETGNCIHTLTGHQSLTSGMELKDNILVSGNADSTVKIWDIKTGQCLQTLQGKCWLSFSRVFLKCHCYWRGNLCRAEINPMQSTYSWWLYKRMPFRTRPPWEMASIVSLMWKFLLISCLFSRLYLTLTMRRKTWLSRRSDSSFCLIIIFWIEASLIGNYFGLHLANCFSWDGME